MGKRQADSGGMGVEYVAFLAYLFELIRIITKETRLVGRVRNPRTRLLKRGASPVEGRITERWGPQRASLLIGFYHNILKSDL